MTRGRNFFGQSPFFKRAFSVTFALFLVLGALGFVGCNPDPDPGEQSGDITPLLGTWKDPTYNDVYTITATNADYADTYGTDDKGIVEFVRNFSSDSGVIIVKYETAKANGRTYGAVYYRELKTTGGTTSVKMGSAGRYDADNGYADITPIITTLEAAKEQFTLDNGDGYYIAWWGGPYIKQ
jgi:hypothetical protein